MYFEIRFSEFPSSLRPVAHPHIRKSKYPNKHSMMMTSRMIDRMMMISSCPSIYTHWNIHTNFSSDPPIADFTLSKIAWHWHLEFTCKEIYIKHIYLIHFILALTFKTCIKKITQRHAPFISVQYVKIWNWTLDFVGCLWRRKNPPISEKICSPSSWLPEFPKAYRGSRLTLVAFLLYLSYCLYLLS